MQSREHSTSAFGWGCVWKTFSLKLAEHLSQSCCSVLHEWLLHPIVPPAEPVPVVRLRVKLGISWTNSLRKWITSWTQWRIQLASWGWSAGTTSWTGENTALHCGDQQAEWDVLVSGFSLNYKFRVQLMLLLMVSLLPQVVGAQSSKLILSFTVAVTIHSSQHGCMGNMRHLS